MSKIAILVVSFGTTYVETRRTTIEAIETAIQQAFPEATVFRAFTSKIVVRRIQENEHQHVDSPVEALKHIQEQGFDELWVQSLHLTAGIEYEQAMAAVNQVRQSFRRVVIGPPLLHTQQDFLTVVTYLKQWYPVTQADEGVLWMGHGTVHQAFASYACLDHMLWGSHHYLGAVESYPEFPLESQRLQRDGIHHVILQPFMLVAGNHAHQDMASEQPGSWQSLLEATGIKVTPVLRGLGSYQQIQQLFVQHLRQAAKGGDKNE